jgi:hypothetical protein
MFSEGGDPNTLCLDKAQNMFSFVLSYVQLLHEDCCSLQILELWRLAFPDKWNVASSLKFWKVTEKFVLNVFAFGT